ncbi:MAG: M1 family metallopeptidase [Anaerolineae bacterium]|nr:M1 family metallopeptidase [Anaerolineae bacterium]
MPRFLLIIFGLVAALILLTGCRWGPFAAATPTQPAPTNHSTPSALPTFTVEPAAVSTPSALPAPESTPAVLPYSTLFEVAWEDRSLFAADLISSEQWALAKLPGATVYHIEVEIDESLTELHGRQQFLYTNRTSTSLDHLYLRLFPQLFGGTAAASDILVNGQPAMPTLSLRGSALSIPLSPPLRPGEQVVVSLTFAITIPTTPEGNYGAFATIDNIMALAHFYPMVSVYNEAGWNIEIAPPAGDVVFAEASFYLVRITAPADLVLITSGITREQQTTGSQQTVTVTAGPARDFYLAGSPDFITISGISGETIVNSYTLPQYEERGRAALDYTLYALELFGRLFGPYPYTELDLASTPNQALGIEYPGVFVNTLNLYNSQERFELYMESTTVHETAHQWFYNIVGNDQLDEPWLDEAMAQYATYLYFLDRYGADGAQAYYDSFTFRWSRGAGNADIPIGLPVGDYTLAEYSAIVYGRGPLFLITLQEEMGVDTFATFLPQYYRTYQWGVATSTGFQFLAEQHCTCDLTTLFEAWVYP